jgi:hypothetical protein
MSCADFGDAFTDLHFRDSTPNWDDIINVGEPAHECALVGRFYVHDRLVGFHLVDGLVTPDFVSGLFKYGDEPGFLKSLTYLGDPNGDHRHASSLTY